MVHLVPICLPGQAGLLDDVGNRIAKAFSTKVAVRPPRFDPEIAFDSSRGQYHSTAILERLLADHDAKATAATAFSALPASISSFPF